MTRPLRLYAAMLVLAALACALPSALPVDPPPDDGRELLHGRAWSDRLAAEAQKGRAE